MKSLFTIALTSAMLASPVAFAKKETKPVKPGSAVMTLKVDAAKSEVKWTGQKVLVKSAHTGTIKVKSGELEWKDNTITKGNFVIDMASLSNTDLKGDPKQADLEGHLKSADFFDVAKFPESKLVITSVKVLPAPAAVGPTHEITGDLTLKGETHSVTFPATITKTDKGAEAVANIKLDRTVWNVKYASDKFFKGLGDKVIANEIELALKISANK
ncbi:MAG: YceI family protein [Bdellovibrio sp.]|jgi:polyisoprenoid-binding protein YceI